MKKLLLLDFDGTLTRSDSLYHFLRNAYPIPVFYVKAAFAAPILLAQKLKMISPDRSKELVLSLFFKNWTEERFYAYAKEFASTYIPKIVYPKALEFIEKNKNEGAEICIVSASLTLYLKEFAKQWDLNVLATNLQFEHGKFTGRYSGKNCNREEKANRICSEYNLNEFDEIIAMGDSDGDLAMFELAHKTQLKPFKI